MLSLFAVFSILSASPESDAAAVVDRMHQAASRADGPQYFSQFTPDARFVGTDSSEHWSLAAFRAYAEPYFARGQGWTYTPRERSLTIAPIDCRCIAWFDETLDNASYGQVRGSGVLRLTEGGWKIEQYVLSFAVPNDRADAVVQAIKARD